MLTRRPKLFENVKQLESGGLVVIIDEQTRNSWKRGRVLKVFPDKADYVWGVVVQTTRGVFVRSKWVMLSGTLCVDMYVEHLPTAGDNC